MQALDSLTIDGDFTVLQAGVATALIKAQNANVTAVLAATGSTCTIGTETNHEVDIEVNGAVVATFDTSGNFGSGTSPGYGIHRKGAGNGAIIAVETSSGTGDCFNYFIQNGTLKAGIGYKNSLAALTLQTGGSDRITIGSTGTITIPAFGAGLVTSNSSGVLSSSSNLTGDVTSSGLTTTLTKSAVVQNVTTQTGTTYTLVPGDANSKILFSNSSGCTVTVDTNANQAIALGATITLKCTGGASAVLTVSAAGGVTINNSTNLSVGDGGIIILQKVATNTWDVVHLYEEYTHTTNWSGIWASAQSGNCTIIRDMRNVSLTIPTTIAAMNTSASISMVTVLPARFRVSANTETGPLVVTNGGTTAGASTLNSSGNITIAATETYGNFSGSGTGGFFRQNIAYTL